MNTTTYYPLPTITRSRTTDSVNPPFSAISRSRTLISSSQSSSSITRSRNYVINFNYRASFGSLNTVAGFGVGNYIVPAIEITDTAGSVIYTVLFAPLRFSGRLNLQWIAPTGVTAIKVRMSKGYLAPTTGHMVISQPKLEIGSKMTSYIAGPSIIGP